MWRSEKAPETERIEPDMSQHHYHPTGARAARGRSSDTVSRWMIACAILLCCGPIFPAAAQDEFEALRQPAVDLAEQMKAAGAAKIAVVDLTDLSGDTLELGRSVAEEVASLLVREGKPLRVIDRLSLAALLEEHKLSATGLIDPESARAIGRVSGVDVLVTGSLTPLEDSVRVTLKAIETETATMVGSVAFSLRKSPAIDRLLRVEVRPGAGQPERTGGYEGTSQFQTAGSLEARLVSFQALAGGNLVATLALRNTRPDKGAIAIAVKAEHSGGIADFWKFFPRATAHATDDEGNRYRCSEVSGLGFARQKSDWNILRGPEEMTATFTFYGSDAARSARSFSLTFELWHVEASWGEGERRATTLTFHDIRPK